MLTSELIAEARDFSRRAPKVGASETGKLLTKLADRLQLILDNEPPDGWFIFGSHQGFEGKLEFSAVLDESGLPRWERHAQ